MSEQLGQNIFVTNREGAGGTIGFRGKSVDFVWGPFTGCVLVPAGHLARFVRETAWEAPDLGAILSANWGTRLEYLSPIR